MDIRLKKLAQKNSSSGKTSKKVSACDRSATRMTSDPEPQASTAPAADHDRVLFLDKIAESTLAIDSGDFSRAISAFSEALKLDPTNHILYSNRSAAYIRVNEPEKALQDAKHAQKLQPAWAKSYLREGVALCCLGRYGDAIVALSCGLSYEPSNPSLLSAILDTALHSPLAEKLQPVFDQLEKMNLHQNAFVTVSVIGQELLSEGHYSESVSVLECALQLGTSSLRLRGSVFSALGRGYWGLGQTDKARHYMEQDLAVSKALGDLDGQCRAQGNLGAAHFSQGDYRASLGHHRVQLALAMKLKVRHSASRALCSLGHIYTAIGDYPNALACHKQAVILRKQENDKLAEAREIGNVGAVYLAMGNFDSAVECHSEHLKLAKRKKDKFEEARAYSNLGSAYHYKRDYDEALNYHNEVLKIAESEVSACLESRAYAGLGHAARCKHDYGTAKYYHEKQLDNALQTKDRVSEGRACSNLGIVFHQLGEYEAALKLHQVHLSIAEESSDRAGQGRAQGNIGIAYSALGQHETALRYHKQELTIACEVNDRHSEAATHGNLAVAYHALDLTAKALHHYSCHLNISRELEDIVSESRALCNIGNFHSSQGELDKAIPFYEHYIALTKEMKDAEGEAKGCFNLGYVHQMTEHHLEAIEYYERNLAIVTDLQDTCAQGRVFCNLGLCQQGLGDWDQALEYQKKYLEAGQSSADINAQFQAMGNIAGVLLQRGLTADAVAMHSEQLQLAKQVGQQSLVGVAYSALGNAHVTMQQYDKALACFTQELTIRQEMSDTKGECLAHGHLGDTHVLLNNMSVASKCYEEELARSRELLSTDLEAQACGKLGRVKLNTGFYEDAIGFFEQQMALLEQLTGTGAMKARGKVLRYLGDCYEALYDFEEAVRWYDQSLSMAQTCRDEAEQDKAYRGLGNAHRALGNLQQALFCFEKRLVAAHGLEDSSARAAAYGELGCLHSLMGNFEQALSCLKQQLRLAEESGDMLAESDAACGLGGVYQQMGDYDRALEYHSRDLHISKQTNNNTNQCRAFGNLGLAHESLGHFSEAVQFQEQHLSMAAQTNDRVARTLAYSSLGRVHHALGHYEDAVTYLQQGLQNAETLGRREDEAKIRHRLGLALWAQGAHDNSIEQMYKAVQLFENIRHDGRFSTDYKLSLFDLQTASYQTLQNVLVLTARTDEALLVAERNATRAFADLLLERQSNNHDNDTVSMAALSVDELLRIIDDQQSLVLYFSQAFGHLYSWLLAPKLGIVHFHESNLSDVASTQSEPEDRQSVMSTSVSLLEQYIGQTQESLGVDSSFRSSIRLCGGVRRSTMSDTESEADEAWQQQLTELGERLNNDGDSSGLLRMLTRGSRLRSSSYSLASMFSVFSNMSKGSQGSQSTLNADSEMNPDSPITALYNLLIQPMESSLASVTDCYEDPPRLVLVVQGELFLVPFALLRSCQAEPCLSQRFHITLMPSVSALQATLNSAKESSGAMIVARPKLPPAIMQQWSLRDLPGSEYEALMVSELLGSRALLGSHATKETILEQISQVEVIHFATHVSWKLSALFVSPPESIASARQNKHADSAYFADELRVGDDSSDMSSIDGPCLSQYLLTAADILSTKLAAKLVVLSSGYADDYAGRSNCDGLVGLMRAILSAGAGCVLLSLWPVPDEASKLLMRNLYEALNQGVHVSQALSHALSTVQASRQFSHASNWGGWLLVGHDVQLSSKAVQVSQAIRQMLTTPDICREAFRVLLHLIEKSLQRIHSGVHTAMYTTQQSVENKVGSIPGWRPLLQALGFKLDTVSPQTDQPLSVFFPLSDPCDRLTQASTCIHAIIGLPAPALAALSKFVYETEVGQAVSATLRDLLNSGPLTDPSCRTSISVRLWSVAGVHEFLASLGFDLVDVGASEVVLQLSRHAQRRHMHLAVHTLTAIFSPESVPPSLNLSSSSSVESVSSARSAGSNTSSSQNSANRIHSIFNPAEMERVKIAARCLHQQNKDDMTTYSRATPTPTNPDLQLLRQSKLRSRYPPPNEEQSFSSESSSGSRSTTPHDVFLRNLEFKIDKAEAFNESERNDLTGRFHGKMGKAGAEVYEEFAIDYFPDDTPSVQVKKVSPGRDNDASVYSVNLPVTSQHHRSTGSVNISDKLNSGVGSQRTPTARDGSIRKGILKPPRGSNRSITSATFRNQIKISDELTNGSGSNSVSASHDGIHSHDIQASHDSIHTSRDNIHTSHDSINTSHDSIQTSHDSMQTSHDSIQTSHDNMQTSHDSIQTSHERIQASHDLQAPHGIVNSSQLPLKHDRYHENYTPNCSDSQSPTKTMVGDWKQKSSDIATQRHNTHNHVDSDNRNDSVRDKHRTDKSLSSKLRNDDNSSDEHSTHHTIEGTRASGQHLISKHQAGDGTIPVNGNITPGSYPAHDPVIEQQSNLDMVAVAQNVLRDVNKEKTALEEMQHSIAEHTQQNCATLRRQFTSHTVQQGIIHSVTRAMSDEHQSLPSVTWATSDTHQILPSVTRATSDAHQLKPPQSPARRRPQSAGSTDLKQYNRPQNSYRSQHNNSLSQTVVERDLAKPVRRRGPQPPIKPKRPVSWNDGSPPKPEVAPKPKLRPVSANLSSSDGYKDNVIMNSTESSPSHSTPKVRPMSANVSSPINSVNTVHHSHADNTQSHHTRNMQQVCSSNTQSNATGSEQYVTDRQAKLSNMQSTHSNNGSTPSIRETNISLHHENMYSNNHSNNKTSSDNRSVPRQLPIPPRVPIVHATGTRPCTPRVNQTDLTIPVTTNSASGCQQQEQQQQWQQVQSGQSTAAPQGTQLHQLPGYRPPASLGINHQMPTTHSPGRQMDTVKHQQSSVAPLARTEHYTTGNNGAAVVARTHTQSSRAPVARTVSYTPGSDGAPIARTLPYTSGGNGAPIARTVPYTSGSNGAPIARTVPHTTKNNVQDPVSNNDKFFFLSGSKAHRNLRNAVLPLSPDNYRQDSNHQPHNNDSSTPRRQLPLNGVRAQLANDYVSRFGHPVSVDDGRGNRAVSVDDSRGNRSVSVRDGRGNRTVSIDDSRGSKGVSVDDGWGSRAVSIDDGRESRVVHVADSRDDGRGNMFHHVSHSSSHVVNPQSNDSHIAWNNVSFHSSKC